MKIKLHENNWTVLIEDLDLRVATQRQMNTIAWLLAKNTAVVIRNQELTLDDELSVCQKIGTIEDYTDPEIIYEHWGKQIDMVVDGGIGGIIPSTVVDCTTDHYEVIRQGAGVWDF